MCVCVCVFSFACVCICDGFTMKSDSCSFVFVETASGKRSTEFLPYSSTR